MAFTLRTAPYHGLPRYAFPAVPFAFVILAALLSPGRTSPAMEWLAPWQRQLDTWIARGFLAAALLFSALLVYALAFLVPRIGIEQSESRLAPYLGTRLDTVGSHVQLTRINGRPTWR